jgi:predicted SnoaL-like aldol condensation-catalyzing enzyme
MPTEPDQLIRTVFAEVIDAGRYELLPELMTDDFANHSPMGDTVGHEGFIAFIETFRAALPGFRHEVIDVVPIGDDQYVWVVRTIATFTGEMMGVQGSGQAIDVYASNGGRLRDGKVAEHWGPGPETMGAILQTMGVTPASVSA